MFNKVSRLQEGTLLYFSWTDVIVGKVIEVAGDNGKRKPTTSALDREETSGSMGGALACRTWDCRGAMA